MGKTKGPTWAQVGEIFHDARNDILEREVKYLRTSPEHGRTRLLLECAFCGFELWAYQWSLCGGGKRCDCGAIIGSDGKEYHFASVDHRQPAQGEVE